MQSCLAVWDLSLDHCHCNWWKVAVILPTKWVSDSWACCVALLASWRVASLDVTPSAAGVQEAFCGGVSHPHSRLPDEREWALLPSAGHLFLWQKHSRVIVHPLQMPTYDGEGHECGTSSPIPPRGHWEECENVSELRALLLKINHCCLLSKEC